MALELQITTNNAAAAIDAVDRGIVKLRTNLQELSAANLGQLGTQFAAIRLDGSAAKGIADLAAAARNLQGTKLETIANSLAQLSTVNISGVTQQVTTLAQSLAGISVPRGLGQLATQLTGIATAAQSAAAAMANLGTAVGGAQAMSQAMQNAGQAARAAQQGLQGVNTTLPGVTTGMGGVAGAANNATGATNTWGNSLRDLQGTLAAVGVALSVQGFANWVKEASAAASKIDQIGQVMSSVSKFLGETTTATDEAAKAQRFLRQTAVEALVPYEGLTGAYGKFVASLRTAKFETADANTIFKDLSAAAGAMGLSIAQTDGVFKAMEQSATKGQIMMEELKGQLGDRMPGALAAMAKALGVGVEQVNKLAETGQIGSNVMGKFARELREMFAGDLAARLNTFSGQWQRLTTQMAFFQEDFGQALNTALVPGIRGLADAMARLTSTGLDSFLGRALGDALGAVSSAISTVVSGLASLASYAQMAGAMINAAFGADIAGPLARAAGVAALLGTAFMLLRGPVMAVASMLGLATLATTVFGGAMAALRVAAAGALMVFTPWGAVIGATVAAVAVAVAYWNSFTATIQAWTNWALNGIQAMLNWINALTGWSLSVEGLRQTLMNLGGAINSTVQSGKELASTLGDQAAAAAAAAAGALDQTANSTNRVADAANGGVSAVGKLAQAHDSGSQSISAYDKELNRMLADMDKEVANAEKAAAAQDRLAASRSRAASAGGGRAAARGSESVYGTSDGYYGTAGAPGMGIYAGQYSSGGSGSMWASLGASGGGLTSHWTGARLSAPAALFTNAPHFAGGGTTGDGGPLQDGGMPAILHPNEAVVPLTGGGAIPIALTGQGQGGESSNRMVGAIRTLDQTVHTNIEATRGGATAIVNELNKLYGSMISIESAIRAMSDKITTSLTSASASSYAGSSSAPDYTGATAGAPTATDASQIPAEWYAANGYSMSINGMGGTTWTKDQQFDDNGEGGSKVGGFGSIRPNAFAFGDLGSSPQAQWIREKGNLSGFFKAYDDQIEAGKKIEEDNSAKSMASILAAYNSSLTPHAEGTPNTGSSAYPAMLHPNEAVIPLPDGRSVPVTLRNADNTSASPSSTVVHVHMTINTPDVDSFRKSQAQIVQGVMREMDRVKASIGKKRAVDDPTAR